MENLPNLKLLLNIKDNEQDGLLQFLLESVIDQVLNYCQIDELPERLNRVVVRMTADLYGIEGYANGGVSATGTGDVTSVRRGDVTTSFGSFGGNFNLTTGAGGAEFLKCYTPQLNAFRRVRWP